MQKISHQCRCDYNGESIENRFYKLCARGGTIALAAAFPTRESRGAAACERAVTVSTDSFIRRPALIDEAMAAISDFVNEAVYALQEPQRSFLCHTALLFIHKGQFRCVLSGNSELLHFCNGRLVKVYSAKEDTPLFGKSLKSRFTSEAAVSLPKGKNVFLLYNGFDTFSYDVAELEETLGTSNTVECWLDKLWKGSKTCSFTALMMPEKRVGIADIFTRK